MYDHKKTIPIFMVLLSSLLLLGCTKQNVIFTPMNYSKNYSVFGADYDNPFIPQDKKRFQPSDEDIQNGLNILEQKLKNNTSIRSLDNYKIQVFGYLNENNEKILWANYFCDAHGVDWKNNLVFVLDGGNCFFNVKINLPKKEIFDLMVNGES